MPESRHSPDTPPILPGGVLWIFFLVLSALAAWVIPFSPGEHEAREWISNPLLEKAAIQFFSGIDALWIIAAAAVVYFDTAARHGLATVRGWAVLILLSSLGIEWLGTATGIPFGPRDYTARFGYEMGGSVPFTIPLLWLIVVFAGHALSEKLPRGAGPLARAALVGSIGLLTAVVIEPVASRVRAYWIWHPESLMPPSSPPLAFYVTWLVLPALLALGMRGGRIAPVRTGWRPIAVILLLDIVFLFADLVHFVRT